MVRVFRRKPLLHVPKCANLIGSIMEYGIVFVLLKVLEQLDKNWRLIIFSVSPKRLLIDYPVAVYDEANEII